MLTADVISTIDLWVEGGLQILPVEWSHVSRAAALRATHYHRSRLPVSLADCTAIALAEQLDGTLVTIDRPMLRLARKIGLTVQPVGNTGG
jgi:predicted nucleic acid-binding protein